MKPESATYQNMLGELEGIVQELSAGEVDLDAMVSQVEKGYGLIKAMRERLDQTKDKIEELHKKYQDEPEDS